MQATASKDPFFVGSKSLPPPPPPSKRCRSLSRRILGQCLSILLLTILILSLCFLVHHCIWSLQRLKSVDFYRKLPTDLTEATLSGAAISIATTFIILFLLGAVWRGGAPAGVVHAGGRTAQERGHINPSQRRWCGA